jgi:osmotically-inducible protein OsmY
MHNLIKLSLLMASLSLLTSCFPLAVAGTAIVGTSIAEERSAGDKLDDNIVAVKIRDKYAKAEFSELLSRISVTVHEGRVMLTGNVKEESYAKQAVDLAWQVPGVKEVINEMEISSYDPKEYAKDTFIANTVRSKLLFHKEVQSVNYKIEVNNGIVYIIGIAQTQDELNNTINAARNLKGVKKVISHVILKTDHRRKKEIF